MLICLQLRKTSNKCKLMRFQCNSIYVSPYTFSVQQFKINHHNFAIKSKLIFHNVGADNYAISYYHE